MYHRYKVYRPVYYFNKAVLLLASEKKVNSRCFRELANRMNVYCMTGRAGGQPPKHDTKRFTGKPSQAVLYT